MKIKHILTFIAVMVSLNVWGQSTYNLNYPDIKIGNSPTGKIVLNGSNLHFPRIGLGSSTDSVLTILNGVIRKVPRSSITSPTPNLQQVLTAGYISNQPIEVAAIAAGSGSIVNQPSQPTHILRLDDVSSGKTIDANTTGSADKWAGKGIAYPSELQQGDIIFYNGSNFSTKAFPGELATNKVIGLLSPNNTTYPTTLAVSNALSDKASLTIDNNFNSNSSWINTYRRISDATFYSQAGWDSFRVNRGTAVTQYGFNAISHAISPGNNFNLAFPSSGFTGTLNAIFRPLGGTVAFLSDITSAGSAYELLANKSTSTTLGTSNTLYPTQNAVQTYVNNKVATGQTIGANTTGNAATATAPANATSFKTDLATSLQDVTSVGNTTSLELRSSNGSIVSGLSYSDKAIIGALSNHALGIYAGATEKVTVLPDGKVGLMNMNPLSALDVNGSARASSNDGNANALVRNADLSNYVTTNTTQNSISGNKTFNDNVIAGNLSSTNSINVMSGTSTYLSLGRQGSTSDATKSNGVINLNRANANGTGSTVTSTLSRPDDNNAYTWFLPIGGGTLSRTVQNVDYEVTDATKGVILRAPDGGRWRLTISNTGVISTTLVP